MQTNISADEGRTDASGAEHHSQALEALEDGLLRVRRDKAKVNRTLPQVGLALSGGGIRSATFCLGLLRGFARNNILPRVDHLSTVSGGGYVGAMFARLVHSIGLERAIATLVTRNSLALQWLRRNGRYLTPAGARDRGLAFATYFRAWAGVQIEMAFLTTLLGLLVVLPHLLHQSFAPEGLSGQLGEMSALWLIAAAFWLLGAPGAMAAYWSAHDPTEGNMSRSRRSALILACASVLLGIFLLWLSDAIGVALRAWARASDPTSAWSAALYTGLGLSLIACGGQMLASLRKLSEKDVAPSIMRGRLTARLRAVMLGTLVLLVLGLLDTLSWRLATWLSYRDEWFGFSLFWTVAASAVLGGLRAVAEPLQKLAGKTESSATWRRRLLDLIGILLALVLVLCWLTLVQWWVFFEPNELEFFTWTWLPGGDVQRWLLAFGVILGWVVLTARNHSMVNASSLYPLYRARLTRAWISVGNKARFQPVIPPQAPTASGSGSAEERERETSIEADTEFAPWKEAKPFELDMVHAVTEVMESDDLALQDCRPEENGGPLHHINVCLNQTRDDHSGMYSADRKGNLLTVNAHGLSFSRIECYYPWPNGEGTRPESGTLGHWTAVSGAAASPGAGSHTSTGWAMSLFLLGMRLGYWMRRPEGVVESSGQLQDSTTQSRAGWLANVLERRCPKPLLLLRELTASFRGLTSPWWFLSDGGHFENMGVYALLRRRLDFIIAADCGADPNFRFADLDNLIRKARVDLDVEIELYDSNAINSVLSGHCQHARALTPEAMAKHASERGVLLARVRYPMGAPGPRYGTLLILKPRIHAHLDLDVMSYAQTHAAFPQQPTSDQFFDEAQWESYQRLGEDLALALTAEWFEQLPGWSAPADAKAATLSTSNAFVAKSQAATAPAIELRRAATTSAAAVGTGLGLGAFTTLLLALWPTVDEMRKAAEREHATRTTLMEDLESYLDSATPLEDGASLPMAQQARVELFLSIDAAALDTWSRGRRQRLHERLVTHCALIDRPSREEQNSPLCGVSPFSVWSDVASYWQVSCERRMRMSTFKRCDKTQTADASTGLDASVRLRPEPHSWLGDSAQYLDPNRLGQSLRELTYSLAEVGAQGTGPRPTEAPLDQVEGRFAVAQSAPHIVGTSAPVAASRCSLQDRLVVYTQVYTAIDAARFERWRASQQSEPATAGGRLQFMQVEDVLASAERKGRKPPFQWGAPVALVHQPEHIECVRELLAAQFPRLYPSSEGGRVRALPASLRATPRVVELWIPPDHTEALGGLESN